MYIHPFHSLPIMYRRLPHLPRYYQHKMTLSQRLYTVTLMYLPRSESCLGIYMAILH
jgi:hypothetical protein